MTSWPLVRLLRTVRARAEEVDQTLASEESYFRFLCDVYGFVASVEPALSVSQFASERARTRLDALAAELRMLDADPDEIARIAHDSAVPLIWTIPEATGWLFVLERAVLQASRLRRRIARGCDAESAADRQAWLELGRFLLNEITSDIDMAVMTSAAFTALDALEDWTLFTSMRDHQPTAQLA